MGTVSVVIIFLMGNHEDMLLEFLGYDGSLGESYLINGGTQFLMSYNLSTLASPEQLLGELPATHMSFFLNLESYAISEGYVTGFNI